jgi:hypothetical protein
LAHGQGQRLQRVGSVAPLGLLISLKSKIIISPTQHMVRGAQGGLTRPAAAKRSCRRRVTDACRTIRELHRLLGKKTSETEILEEALEHATSQKTAAAAAVAAEGRFPTKTVAELIGVSRSN